MVRVQIVQGVERKNFGKTFVRLDFFVYFFGQCKKVKQENQIPILWSVAKIKTRKQYNLLDYIENLIGITSYYTKLLREITELH